MYSKQTVKTVDSVPVYRFFPDVKDKGNRFFCKCPSCGAEGKKKSKTKGLQIVYDEIKGQNFGKCWDCNFTIRGALNTYAYLNGLDTKRDFIKIVEGTASQFGISIEKEDKKIALDIDGKPTPGSFVYRQLKESGLTVKDITAEVIEDGVIKKLPVFQKGSINTITGKIDYYADEMVILYYNLEGKRKTYMPVGARAESRERPYSRVRYSNPEAKADKYGKPVKYQTPAGARAEIYIPDKIRQAYKNQNQFDTLFIQEGEKKAEKACKHGIMSVAIQGIYNIGRKNEGLPSDIQYLVQRCGIKNIVLLFDSDWQDLSRSLEPDDDVDSRPRQFAKAAIKFKRFIKTLHQSKLYVDIWFGHINENNSGAKGIDDLLCGPLEGAEFKLKDDIDHVMGSVSGEGQYLSIHNISTSSEYQILDYWGLNSKDTFFERHRHRLLGIKTFRFDKVFYKVEGENISSASEFGKGSEFWSVYYDEKEEKKIKHSGIMAKEFLQTNGFRSHIDEEDNNTFVRIDRGIIHKIRLPEIHRFIFDFVSKASKDDEILEYFFNNLDSKFSQSKMNLLEPLITNAGVPEQYTQRFYYRNAQIAIDESGIKTEPLIGPVWQENLIKREFSRIKIFEDIERNEDGSFNIRVTDDGAECEFLTYLKHTSTFNNPKVSPIEETKHLINKLSCIGYLLRSYRSFAETKVVIGMDARMSEIGSSNGRSGKSLVGLALKQMLSQSFIDGRKLKESDEFIFNVVRKTTNNVFIDDVNINFNIGFIYANLTGDFEVNVKGGKRFTIPFELAPKIYLTTNHAIKSEGDSTKDRTIFMAFSPYYNTDFTPTMEFGHMFFSDWDERQWLLFDNLMLECVHLYFKSLYREWGPKKGCGAIPPPMDMLSKREERQIMGEAFLQWAEAYFSPEEAHLNSRIFRHEMFKDFHAEFPGNSKFVTPNNFKNKLIAFCKFKGLHMNSHRQHKDSPVEFKEWITLHPMESFIGKDEKTGGKEYITISE